MVGTKHESNPQIDAAVASCGTRRSLSWIADETQHSDPKLCSIGTDDWVRRDFHFGIFYIDRHAHGGSSVDGEHIAGRVWL